MKHLFKLIVLILLLGFVVGCASNINSLSFTNIFNEEEPSLVEDYEKELVVNVFDDYSNSDSDSYIHSLHLLCGYQKNNHLWGEAEENYVNLNLTISNNSESSIDSYDKLILFSDSLIGNNDFILFECSGSAYLDNEYLHPTKIAYYDTKLYVLDDDFNSVFVINNYNFTQGSYYYYFNLSDSVEFVGNNNNENNENNGNNTPHVYSHTLTITNTEHAYLSNNSSDRQQNYYLNDYSFTFIITNNSDSQINTYNDLYNYFINANSGNDYIINGSGVKTPHIYYSIYGGEGNEIPTNLNKIKYSNNSFKYGFDSNSWFNVKFLNTTEVNPYYDIEYDFVITDYTFSISDSVSLIS